VAGLIGHALVLLVVVRDRHQRSRVISNSYIASLSVADIGFLLGLPFVIATLSARRWLFGISLCKVRTTPEQRPGRLCTYRSMKRRITSRHKRPTKFRINGILGSRLVDSGEKFKKVFVQQC